MDDPVGRVPLHPQLQSICEAHPWAPKVVLVPRTQLGRALEDALARREGQWAGVSCLLPRRYAAQLARPVVHRSGRTELPVAGQAFLMAHLLRSLDEGALPDGLPGPPQLAPTIAEAVETLRLDGVSRSAVQERAEAPDASATFRAVAACYARYHDLLDRNELYDDAHVFRWAAARVREGADALVSETVVALCDGTTLPGRAASFVEALRDHAAECYRLGAPQPDGAPPTTVAGRFGSWSVPRTSPTPEEEKTWTFERAVGRSTEVEAVLRAVLEEEVPFDDVEIAFTESGPYLSRLADLADEVGIPLTVGPGRPAPMTTPGQALFTFLRWITEGFDAELLIRMLRSGHLRVDRVQSENDALPVLEAHEVATLLAERRYEPGRRGYRNALQAAIEEVQSRIDDLEDDNEGAEREKETRARLERVHDLVDTLLDLAPRKASVQGMARQAQRFLERVGPTDPPPDTLAEEEHTLDQAARGVLWQKLDALTDLPFAYEASGAQLAGLLRRWVEGQYVRAEHPRPGAVHVLPLESAGYGDRSHLSVVGMDGDTFSAAEGAQGLLQEADRQALRTDDGASLPDPMPPADEGLWRATRALARHAGPTALYSRIYDLESGEERHPSPLFLRLEAAVGAGAPAEPVGLVPPSSGVPLRDSDAWLAAYRVRGAPTGEETARAAVREKYPWIGDGEQAAAARRGDRYSVHDGLLPSSGVYPALDLFDGTSVSASRLETLAETPYVYFLKYVLGVEPLDEPALDEMPWLSPLRRGAILHDTFERFMWELDGRGPVHDDEKTLLRVLEDRIEEEVAQIAPQSQVVEEAARRQLRRDARVFLRAEIEHTARYDPEDFELGFGFGPRRRREQDEGSVTLDVGGRPLSLRGRIDRVDRAPNGAFAIWDYKTGRASAYDEDDPLQDGAHLQWALYAYVLEDVRGPVRESGYFFPTTEEMGTRISFRPEAYRQEVDALMERLASLARNGSFPMTPDAKNASAWRYRGYDRLVHDLRARSRTLKEKTYPEDRPTPPFLD